MLKNIFFCFKSEVQAHRIAGGGTQMRHANGADVEDKSLQHWT